MASVVSCLLSIYDRKQLKGPSGALPTIPPLSLVKLVSQLVDLGGCPLPASATLVQRQPYFHKFILL
nr:unnamed protein product [Haemonchus contortus]